MEKCSTCGEMDPVVIDVTRHLERCDKPVDRRWFDQCRDPAI